MVDAFAEIHSPAGEALDRQSRGLCWVVLTKTVPLRAALLAKAVTQSHPAEFQA